VAIVSFSKPIDWPEGGRIKTVRQWWRTCQSGSVICALSITLLPVRFCTRQYFADQNNAKQSRPTIQQKIG